LPARKKAPAAASWSFKSDPYLEQVVAGAVISNIYTTPSNWNFFGTAPTTILPAEWNAQYASIATATIMPNEIGSEKKRGLYVSPHRRIREIGDREKDEATPGEPDSREPQ
jgi:hypothetical protein